jgi:hypothetical protein
VSLLWSKGMAAVSDVRVMKRENSVGRRKRRMMRGRGGKVESVGVMRVRQQEDIDVTSSVSSKSEIW